MLIPIDYCDPHPWPENLCSVENSGQSRDSTHESIESTFLLIFARIEARDLDLGLFGHVLPSTGETEARE